MDGQANGAAVADEPADDVVKALDAIKAAYLAGDIEAIAFCSVRPDGKTGPAGWIGKQGEWGATLGYSIHLLGFRYDAMICAAGVANAPMMSEADVEDMPESTRREHGLGPTE